MKVPFVTRKDVDESVLVDIAGRYAFRPELIVELVVGEGKLTVSKCVG